MAQSSKDPGRDGLATIAPRGAAPRATARATAKPAPRSAPADKRATGKRATASSPAASTKGRTRAAKAAPAEPVEAFGAPGVSATWAPAAKQGVGTAPNPASPLWFTIAQGVVTELYYPRVDVPNTRDLQFMALLPGGGVVLERDGADATIETVDPEAPAYHVVTTDRHRRFTLDKRILTDPDAPALAMRVRWRHGRGMAGARLFALLAPHMGARGAENSARVVRHGGRTLIVAWRHDAWLALGASIPFRQCSCGFVGVSDGYTDLSLHRDMQWRFDCALGGNVAVTAELEAFEAGAFTLAVGFGRDREEACQRCIAAADADFARLQRNYVQGWRRWTRGLADLAPQSGDGGHLYRMSALTLKTHEDKPNPGAHIASLAVPWGEVTSDNNAGGYHLVWPRDLYHSATARLAAGDAAGAGQALHYLRRTQRADGSWPQNFWVYGEPHWRGLQLDEVAFPILLAWQLLRADALAANPYPGLVAPAAYAVARIGPVTPQERWEENAGYSPSTLAVCIAALVCAADFARRNADPIAAEYFLDVADHWEAHVEDWTFTTEGSLAGFRRYYERIASPVEKGPPGSRRDFVSVANHADHTVFDARSIVGCGFLELVRYGVRPADDPHILQGLQVYDAICGVKTPNGPCWKRYDHDGYGQKANGDPFDGTGIGRAWPLLTGERAHYELAAGGRFKPLRAALEAFAWAAGMLPEQVWDQPDLPEKGLRFGGPTGSAAPLCWAHAEYIKLLRSLRDGQVFDCPPPVRERYARPRSRPHPEIWKFSHQLRWAEAGQRFAIEVYGPGTLHWSADDWRTVHHDPMSPRGRGVWTFIWAAGAHAPGTCVRFTFYWHEDRRWEGRDFAVTMR